MIRRCGTAGQQANGTAPRGGSGLVALSDACQRGAQTLDAATRLRLGNDPLNLLAVDGPTNQAKGDGDAATWLPPVPSYRCAYVARQVEVKARYGAVGHRGRTGRDRAHPARLPGQQLPPDSTVPARG